MYILCSLNALSAHENQAEICKIVDAHKESGMDRI